MKEPSNERKKFDEYRSRWSFGTIIDRSRRIDAEELRRQLVRRALDDDKFFSELNANPRYVWAIAVEEGLGIKARAFLYAIRQVNVFSESRDTLYLKLPACHRGCSAPGVNGAPEGHAEGSCHVCGSQLQPTPADLCDFKDTGTFVGDARRKVERHIRIRASLDAEFKRQLLAAPLETYLSSAIKVDGTKLPSYLAQIQEVRVVEEERDEIHFIVPTAESFDA